MKTEQDIDQVAQEITDKVQAYWAELRRMDPTLPERNWVAVRPGSIACARCEGQPGRECVLCGGLGYFDE